MTSGAGSQSRLRFVSATADADVLCSNVARGRGNFTLKERRVQYHAALAAYVAAWEAYLESLVREFLVEVADPLDLRFTALANLLSDRVNGELKRFNTPNSKNSRDLLYGLTGYDPINDWNWPAKSMAGPVVRSLLDEIVKVRHSFAHGFSMPCYAWNTNSKGDACLTATAMRLVHDLFVLLVSKTDEGLDLHIKGAYGRVRVWY